MSSRSLGLGEPLYEYLLQVGAQEPAVLQSLRVETAQLPEARMQISPEQGRFMSWLLGTLGAHRCLEVGVFTGYSSICTALALPPGGVVVACDVSLEYTQVARRYWQQAQVEDRIQLRLGPALETLQQLVNSGEPAFDFAFVDADKENYVAYYELCLQLVRPGGVLVFDNALWGGSVADETDQRETTVAIRALNVKVCADPRVSATLIPVGDGLLMARRL